MKYVLLAAMIAVTVGGVTRVSAQSGCGIEPLKPLPPLGCKDLIAACQCDANGKNCRWIWHCVPE